MEETDFKTHHSRHGLPARLVAFATFYTRGFSSLTWLHRCSDCYRAERISSQAGLAPAVDHHLFTAHPVIPFSQPVSIDSSWRLRMM